MLHHEESPVKPQYMAATTPSLMDKPPAHFSLPPPLQAKSFNSPPRFPSILKKSNALYEGGGESSNYDHYVYFNIFNIAESLTQNDHGPTLPYNRQILF